MVFPIVKYGCECWAIKKAEHQRIDAFELWCWTRLLRVPSTARRSNKSILKEISPECSLEGLMLKLKLQYFGHLMQRADSLGKILMLGNIESKRKGRRRKRRWKRMKWLDAITNSMNMSLNKLWEMLKDREAYHVVVHGVTKSQTWCRDWTKTYTSRDVSHFGLSRLQYYLLRFLCNLKTMQCKSQPKWKDLSILHFNKYFYVSYYYAISLKVF